MWRSSRAPARRANVCASVANEAVASSPKGFRGCRVIVDMLAIIQPFHRAVFWDDDDDDNEDELGDDDLVVGRDGEGPEGDPGTEEAKGESAVL